MHASLVLCLGEISITRSLYDFLTAADGDELLLLLQNLQLLTAL